MIYTNIIFDKQISYFLFESFQRFKIFHVLWRRTSNNRTHLSESFYFLTKVCSFRFRSIEVGGWHHPRVSCCQNIGRSNWKTGSLDWSAEIARDSFGFIDYTIATDDQRSLASAVNVQPKWWDVLSTPLPKAESLLNTTINFHSAASRFKIATLDITKGFTSVLICILKWIIYLIPIEIRAPLNFTPLISRL